MQVDIDELTFLYGSYVHLLWEEGVFVVGICEGHTEGGGPRSGGTALVSAMDLNHRARLYKYTVTLTNLHQRHF